MLREESKPFRCDGPDEIKQEGGSGSFSSEGARETYLCEIGVRVQLVTVAQVFFQAPALRTSGPSYAAWAIRSVIGCGDREHFVVLHLDAKSRVLSAEVASTGTLTASLIHPREVFKGTILANAAAIICGHNHPSGDVMPSPEDLATCRRLTRAGQLLGIPLLDFVIVSGADQYWAMSEHPK